MKIADFSVNRPMAITMLILAMVLVGIYFLPKLAVDLMPDMELPVSIVITNYPGASPAEVEKNVSEPMEATMATVSDIRELQSISQYGLSLVVVQFNWGTNMDTAINNMRERVDMVKGRLPNEATTPTLMKLDLNAMPIIIYSLKGADLITLNNLAEDTIKPRLERINGVASVDTSGGREREIQVLLDPAKLQSYGISVPQIAQAIGADSVTGNAGSIDRGTREVSLRVLGEYTSIADINNIQISLGGANSIPLRNIAEVRDSYKRMDSYAYVDGETALTMSVMKASGGNTVQVARSVQAEVEALNAILPAGVEILVFMDTSEFIQHSLSNIIEHGLLGALIATVLLFLFFRSFRSTLVIIIVLPISVITTFSLMYFSGQTINIITMAGMLLGLGSLIDFAVVVLESIYRHREENYGIIEAAKKGASEVGVAVMACASCQIVVFLPILFVEGLAGVLFKPLALVVIFSHIAALFTAVTLVPMLSSQFLVKVTIDDDSILQKKTYNPLLLFGKFIFWLKHAYRAGLFWALGHRKSVVGITCVLLIASFVAMGKVGAEFMPTMDEGRISMRIELASGTKLDDTAVVVKDVEELVRRIVPEVKSISSTVGGGGNMSFFSGTSGDAGTLDIELIPIKERSASTEDIVERLRQATTGITGADISVSADSGMAGGGGGVISITIRGDNLDVLKQLGVTLVGLLDQVEGTREVTSSMDEAKLETHVVVNREQAARYGLSANQILSTVRASLDGQLAGRMRTQEDELNIRLFLDYDMPVTVGNLANMTITSPTGARVPLSAVATIESQDSPTAIYRSSQSRQVTVTSDVSGRDIGSINTDIQKILSDFNLPEGYIIESGGETQDMIESFTSLGIALLLSILLMFMVMVALFESLLQPFVIMFSLPPTFVGAVFGLLITGHTLSVSAFLGATMLVGVVVNNAIVLVDYINTIRKRGVERNEAILQAGPIRLRPIIITALSTILVLTPMAFRSGEGSEMQQPMAIVVVFGLLVSTLVTLFLVPVVYTIFDDLSGRVNRLFAKKPKVVETTEQLLEEPSV